MNKFYLNDVVRGEYKNITPVGLVATISDGKTALLEFDADRTGYWSDNYPGWIDRPVYRVWLPNPLKCIEYKDFLDYYTACDTANVRKIYEKMVDDVKVLSFCEEELTLVAESGSDQCQTMREQLEEELSKKFCI